MTLIFDYSKEQLVDKKAFDTANEIHQQPSTWAKTVAQVRERSAEIKKFIEASK